MSGKTELRQAELISQQKVVPGTGTLTGITVSAPITGGGVGPVVPIGATQFSAIDAGFVPSPGVNNHTKQLWDDGWFVASDVDNFVHLQVATPGTPDTGNVNVTGAGIFGGVSMISSAPGDTATATTFFSATDTGANTYNASIGIELPNSVGVAGDLVVRTGGTGASGSGTERLRVFGADGRASAVGQTENGGANPQLEAGPLGTLPFGESQAGGIEIVSIDSAEGNNRVVIGVHDMLGNDNDNAMFLAPTTLSGVVYGGEGSFFIGGKNTGGNFGRISINTDNTGYFRADAGVDIRGGALDSGQTLLSLASATGISLLAQTSATDGSNANPTVVVRANTGQTAPSFQAQDSDLSVLLTLNNVADTLNARSGFSIIADVDPDGTPNANGSSIFITTNGPASASGLYSIDGTTSLHTWDSNAAEMTFDNSGKLTVPGVVDAASYSAGGTAGITGTLTTASLIGKTLTFTAGLITGFA